MVVDGINDLKTEAPICNYKDLILANFSGIVLYWCRWASILPEAASQGGSDPKVIMRGQMQISDLKNTKFETLSMRPLQFYAAVTKVRKEENLVEREPARTSAEQVIAVVGWQVLSRCGSCLLTLFDKEQNIRLFDYIFVIGSAKRDDPRQNSKARETVNVVHLSTFSVPVQQNIQQVDRRWEWFSSELPEKLA